jgi:membrane-associated phospholipid phosphatase
MRPGNAVSLSAFLFFIVAGWLRRLAPKQRCRLASLGLLGAFLILMTQFLSKWFPVAARAIGDWLPSILLLLVYWQAGRFINTPNEGLQAWLERFDRRRLGAVLRGWNSHVNTNWIGSYFELAYLFCYVLIPLGIGILYLANLRIAIDTYWATVLPATYICYGVIPFAQTLPPRLRHGNEGLPCGKQKIRTMNLFILRHGSIQLNTFPSAHVASTVGASLVLIHLLPVAGLVFLVISASIAVGAVVGRYHYALDVIFGAALSVGIFSLIEV